MDSQQLQEAELTVIHVARYMQTLQGQATAFQVNFETGHRGYFTPSEEDQVASLWTSYHKARNALLDLIDDILQTMPVPKVDGYAEFMVAYAAAITLVHAARFLRDLFWDDEIVRGKLNEAFPAYGIAEGSFDAVQMSLTDPANALKIYRANQFFKEHQESIRSFAESDPQLQEIFALVLQLGHAVDVRKTRYVQVRVADRRYQFNDAVMQGGVFAALYAIQEWGSRFVSSLSTMPGHVPRIPAKIANEIQGQLRPGDIFITRKESALTNYFLPGYWPHAAFYVGDGKVIEALKDGVRERTLESPFGNDATTVIRPNLPIEMIEQAIHRARTHVGKPYDFDFDFTRADRLVCTEVVYRSLEGLNQMSFQLTRRTGRLTLSAEDLLQMALEKQQLNCVVAYCPAYAKKLLDSSRVPEMLRSTIGQTEVVD